MIKTMGQIVEQKILRDHIIRNANVIRAEMMLIFPHQEKYHNKKVLFYQPRPFRPCLPEMAHHAYVSWLGKMITLEATVVRM